MPAVSMVWPAQADTARPTAAAKFVAGLAGGGEQQAGGGAELAGAAGDGGDVLLGERVNLFGGAVEGAGEDEDRVERGHLGVDRDGLGPGGGGAHQGDAGGTASR